MQGHVCSFQLIMRINLPYLYAVFKRIEGTAFPAVFRPTEGSLSGSALYCSRGPPLTVFIEMCIGTPDRHVAGNE